MYSYIFQGSIMKYFYLCLFSFLFSIDGFSLSYEIPFNPKNKAQFYLNKSHLSDEGVSINKNANTENNVFLPNISILNFEKLKSHLNLKFENISLIKDSQVGDHSGLFYQKTSYVQFPFYGSFDTGMSMKFWLKPFSTEIGQIFATEYLSSSKLSKELTIFFNKGKLVFRFNHLFISHQRKKPVSVEITSKSYIPSNKWGHHFLEYNPSNGQLNYYYNGNLEAQIYVTNTQTEGNALLFLDLPAKSNFILGKGFRGLMDQFVLTNNLQDESVNHFDKSYLFTRVIDLKSVSLLYNISLDSFLPKDSGTKIEYRYSRLPFSDDISDSLIPWEEYDDKTIGKNQIKVRYLQIKTTLFRDPTDEKSPLLKKLTINYSPLEIPTKPINIGAISSSGSLIVSLQKNMNQNISGFKIYLGSKRNQYFGEPEANLESPLFIPVMAFTENPSTNQLTYKIDGLIVDKLYFIRVSSVSADGIESDLSEEESVRIRNIS